MRCAFCHREFKQGETRIPMDAGDFIPFMHPSCAVRSESGELPPPRSSEGHGLFQLLGSHRRITKDET